MTTHITDWLYDEFHQVGKDYGSPEEVAAYDASHAKFRDVVTENQKMLDTLAVKPGQSLVDIGCGTGVLAIEAAKRGLTVFALDVSDAMLSFAQTRAAKAGIEGVHFLKGGFLNLPQEISKPDFIVTSFSFHHLPDFWKLVALKKIYALLSASGKLLIQDVVIEEVDCISNINAFVDSQAALGGDFLREDAIEHFQNEYSTYSWVLESMLSRAGFCIEYKELFVGLIAKYICGKNE